MGSPRYQTFPADSCLIMDDAESLYSDTSHTALNNDDQCDVFATSFPFGDPLKREPPMPTSLLAVMSSPQNQKEQLLVHGFVRERSSNRIPGALAMMISHFYPQLYGGRYSAGRKHTASLPAVEELRTKTFRIQDIKITVALNEEEESCDGQQSKSCELYSDLKESNATWTVLRVSIRCSATHQSHTKILTLDARYQCSYPFRSLLGIFGPETSLSSLVCDVQILEMETKDDALYKYPLRMSQSKFVLEWPISSEMVDQLKQCDKVGRPLSFESTVFNDMFLLHCHLENRELHIDVMLVALPMDRQTEGHGLRTKCTLMEANTKTLHKFDMEFDYEQPSRGQSVGKVADIKDGTDLNICVGVTVLTGKH